MFMDTGGQRQGSLVDKDKAGGPKPPSVFLPHVTLAKQASQLADEKQREPSITCKIGGNESGRRIGGGSAERVLVGSVDAFEGLDGSAQL